MPLIIIYIYCKPNLYGTIVVHCGCEPGGILGFNIVVFGFRDVKGDTSARA